MVLCGVLRVIWNKRPYSWVHTDIHHWSALFNSLEHYWNTTELNTIGDFYYKGKLLKVLAKVPQCPYIKPTSLTLYAVMPFYLFTLYCQPTF
jgi:hypothetical protein